jgi:hypothetical protein
MGGGGARRSPAQGGGWACEGLKTQGERACYSVRPSGALVFLGARAAAGRRGAPAAARGGVRSGVGQACGQNTVIVRRRRRGAGGLDRVKLTTTRGARCSL